MRQRCHLRMTEPMGGALHIRRRYVALFLGNRTTTSRFGIKNNAGVTATGCIIYYSVVCCEGASCYPQKHTLRVYYILLRGCFSVCLFQLAVVGQITEQADASTHVFLFVVSHDCWNRSQLGALRITLLWWLTRQYEQYAYRQLMRTTIHGEYAQGMPGFRECKDSQNSNRLLGYTRISVAHWWDYVFS